MTFLCLTSMFSGRKTRWGMENALISSQQAIHVGSASPAGLQGPLLPATGSFCHWAHQAGQKEALPRWNQCPHSAQHCLFFFFFSSKQHPLTSTSASSRPQHFVSMFIPQTHWGRDCLFALGTERASTVLSCSLDNTCCEAVTRTETGMTKMQVERCQCVKAREKRGKAPTAEWGLNDVLYY